MVTMTEFTGSKLTYGAFLQMNEEINKLITQATPLALKLEAEAPVYAAAIGKMDKLTPVFSSYKDMHRHELMKETTEITGFIDQLAKDDNMVAVNAAGQFFASEVITKFIADANTVVTHYQTVAANQAKKAKKETKV